MTMSALLDRARSVEWPTLGLILICYTTLLLATGLAEALTLWIAVPAAAVAITLHSSLQHEVIHGHPTPSERLNELLVAPAVGLFVPFGRFKDTHIRHHANPEIADPFEDPESRYVDPDVWRQMSPAQRRLRRFNNTLLGRLTIGPVLSLAAFYRDDVRSVVLQGNRRALRHYLWHLPALAPVIWWLASVATMPWWAYLAAAYAGYALLLIRTFLEHQAHERHGARTVIIEDRGPLALLFLNNNLHAVHHARPELAWYRLPATYRARRQDFLRRNGSYRYASYGEVIRNYLFAAKDPVPYPLVPLRKRGN